MGGDSTPAAVGSADGGGGPADGALVALVDELGACLDSLGVALERARQLRAMRAEGTTWREAVESEERPLIVERITRALETLNSAGSRWRREEACALHADGVSISGIATLFGVTRQRASVLVRGSTASSRSAPAPGDPSPGA